MIQLLRQGKSYVKYLYQLRNHFTLPLFVKSTLFFLYESKRNSGHSHFLQGLDIEVTSRCSLNCNFCYYAKNKNKYDDLDISYFKSVIDQCPSQSIIFIGGGEPFEREDILDFISYIKNSRMVCSIVTNGISLTKDHIDQLVELEVDSIFFSLHGPKEVHNKITGSPIAYDNIIENMRYLVSRKNRKTKVCINSIINQNNRNVLKNIVDIGNEIGVDIIKFEHLHYIDSKEKMKLQEIDQKYAGKNHSYVYSIKSSSVQGEVLYEELQDLIKTSKVPVIIKPNLSKEKIRSWYKSGHYVDKKCPYIYRFLYINPYGDVFPCQYIRESLGNIKENKLNVIWNSKKYKKMRNRINTKLSPVCHRCCKI